MGSTDTLGRQLLSKIDTSVTRQAPSSDDDYLEASPLRTFSSNLSGLGLPSFRLSTSPISDGPSSTYHPEHIPTNLRVRRNESRKLLSHVLHQLANRKKPSPVKDTVWNGNNDTSTRGFGMVTGTLKNLVKIMPDKRVGIQNDSDDEETRDFSTDETFDLMIQLEDVLTMSIEHGWKIFDDGIQVQDSMDNANPKISSSTFRNSFRSGGKRPRSLSLSKDDIHVPELLFICVSILASVVAEDCRYKIALPRPERPPNALQILTLNIAQFLIHFHRHDPRIISHIAFAMIPAFSTFPPQMHIRLLNFFETNIVRLVLQDLGRLQGLSVTERFSDGSNVDFFNSVDQYEGATVSIQIDEVRLEGEESPQHNGPLLTPSMYDGVQSSNHPHQSPHIYYLAFLVPPLLSIILDSIGTNPEFDENSQIVLRLDSLLATISVSKIDTYNDLLEIIAYHGPRSRRLAISFMAKFWPKAAGHTSISSPLCAPLQPHFQVSKHSHAHQFVPWHFNFNEARLHPNVMSHMDCRSCTNPLRGFALICPFCKCAVHFDCYDYPEGNYQFQYSMAADPVVQRLAMFRYSDLGTDTPAHTAISGGHDFRPVNWFTLCLCYACQKPLWGCIAQGLRCRLCSVSVHFDCLDSLGHSHPCETIAFTSMHMTISWENLRNSCLAHFSPVLGLTRDQLNGCSREEISIYHAVFRTQLQLLTSGMAMGSIIITENRSDALYNPSHELTEFELSQFTNWCDQLLGSNKLPCSPLTQQFLQDKVVRRIDNSLMHEWSYLEYISSNLKMSLPQGQNSYECVSLFHMRDILRTDFAIQSDDAARFILDHLYHLSFFDRIDHELRPFSDLSRREVRCIFPLPFGLDISTNVEFLVSSVEACLTDLDLSSNEFGFLLLTRRLWPNHLASEYGLKRLAGRVLGWILKEDDSLATILREFVARKKELPGIRSDKDIPPWPSLPNLRPSATSLSSNGGDYVTARHLLLSRFAVPWLLELHELDSALYGQVVFDTCSEVAADQNPVTQLSRHCESLLRSIIKLCHTSVIFSVFDFTFIRWMEFASQLEQWMPLMQRFFGTESESSQRYSSGIDLSSPTSDKLRVPLIDPLHAVLSLATQSEDGLSRSLLYLSMLAKSGVNIPTSFFKQFSSLIDFNGPNSLNNANTLLNAILLSLWQTANGRQELQNVIAMLHSRLANQVLECLLSGEGSSVALSVIRHSLAACLRIYGCGMSRIRDAMMVLTEVQQLPSRRKLSVQKPIAVDPMIIDAKIMASLELYLGSHVEDVSCLTAKFFNMFLTESPFLEAFEVDNFILRNGKVLASCIWVSYGIQQEDVAIVRTNLLLRCLIVDSDPFQDILHSCLNYSTSPSQQRLSSVNRLFRMISDVTSPAFNVEGRQWRSSVIEIFYYYFTALWADPMEEVRLSVQSSSAALLPAHLEVISQCWDESLSKAPIAERVRLISFLIQLHPHFPNWKVLSWEVIVETLMEYDDDTHDGSELRIRSPIDSRDSAYGAPDLETTLLRASILLLSLQMISDGIEIDGFSLMKLNFQYLKISGFSEVSLIPAQTGPSFLIEFGNITDVPGSAFPCIEELVHVVDAAYFLDLPHMALGVNEEQEKKTSRVLIGTIFIDSCLSLISNLPDLTCLPVLTLKSLFGTLYILVHKYDFEDKLLRHLQPSLRRSVLRTIELLSRDISYELRQLSLSIAQESIKKWHSFFGTSTVSDILELVAAEVASQRQNNQDPLVLQCKLLIGNTLQSFSNNGLLFSLIKRSLKGDFFVVLKQVLPGKEHHASDSLRDILLRDTLQRAVDCDSASFQTALMNILKFIEIVHFQHYSADMMMFIGQYLTNSVRRMSDGTIDGADASPLIYIAVILVRNNKRNSKDLLPVIDVVLRVALNRLHLDASCLGELISVTTPHRPKAQESTQGGVDVINVLFDILGDGFRMKTKMAPSTIKVLIEVLMLTENAPLAVSPPLAQKSLLSNLADDACSFLQNHPWHDDPIENDFGAAIAIGKLVLQAARNNPTIFQKFAELASDRPSRYSYGIRSWNILLLASFQEVHDESRSMLYSHFLTFTNAYSTLVRGYIQAGIPSLETATADVNQLHISTKLWLMLVQSLSPLAVSGEAQIFTVWNELWSAQESLLNVLEMEAQAGLYPTLISLACTSIADILMYMRSLRSPLAIDTSAHVAVLTRLRVLNNGDSSNKVVRAIRFMSETTPEAANRVLLVQIIKELIAAEKLRVVETKQDHGRSTGDRFRKDMRPQHSN